MLRTKEKIETISSNHNLFFLLLSMRYALFLLIICYNQEYYDRDESGQTNYYSLNTTR